MRRTRIASECSVATKNVAALHIKPYHYMTDLRHYKERSLPSLFTNAEVFAFVNLLIFRKTAYVRPIDFIHIMVCQGEPSRVKIESTGMPSPLTRVKPTVSA